MLLNPTGYYVATTLGHEDNFPALPGGARQAQKNEPARALQRQNRYDRYQQSSLAADVRTLAFLCAALTVFAPLLAVAQYNLPSMGQPADTVLPPAQAERIGARVVSKLHAHNRILEDPQLAAYINRIGNRLVRHTRKSPSDFQFYIIDSGAVNAFALPGGYIAVNAGLIMATDTESELAGVLAHEVSHITQHHIARQIQATQGVTIATAAAVLLAILAGGGNPAVTQAAITMGLANIGQQRISYTRAHELEADRLGIRLLAESNFNPHGMVNFFQEMAERARLYGSKLPELLRTHPLNTTRIAEARSRVKDFTVKNVKESADYPFMRARARVLTSNRPSEVIQYFQNQRKGDQSAPAVDYGYALALLAVGRSKPALKVLRQLQKAGIGQPHAALALADALMVAGQKQAALDVLVDLHSRYRSYRPVILAYAKALIANGKARQARQHLLDQAALLNRDPAVHKLLARASAQLGDTATAYYQQARMYYLRGRYAAAIYRLKTAMDLEALSSDTQRRIQAALSRYRTDCRRALSESKCEALVENFTQG